MTTTITPNPADQAVEQRISEPVVPVVPLSRREAALARLTTATADSETGQRVRALLGELREIEADRQMADRFPDPGSWPAELDCETRDVWDHIAEALAPVSSTNKQNTKEQISDGD